jgi:hypothetical protein
MTSLQQMADQCEALIDTKDVSAWENEFLESVCESLRFKRSLSAKQSEILERIWSKHYAG